MTRRVLAVSAHPDDETLGCGGTLLKHVAEGDLLEWLILTGPWEPLVYAAFIARRRRQIDAVSSAYGMGTVHELGFPTTRLDAIPFGDVLAAVRRAVQAAAPDIVYVVHPGDVHSDHRVTFDATWAVLKGFEAPRVQAIYCYETLSSTNFAPPFENRVFVPQAYRDISPFLEKKLEILALYEGEVFAHPHPRSVESARSLARLRGSVIGALYAEAFAVMRLVF
jgi:LmbE family N-acetylglucosaminyl deacetylase